MAFNFCNLFGTQEHAFETLYDTGIIQGFLNVKFTKIVRYKGKSFRMRYYHYYDPMRGHDIKCTVSVQTPDGIWGDVTNVEDFPDIPYLVPDRRDEEKEEQVVTMLQDFIKAVY